MSARSNIANERRAVPKLLVSVRDAQEAAAAVEGGADWIDLKEPFRGPLGAVDAQAATEVATLLAGRLPLSAAAGELVDWPNDNAERLLAVEGIRWIKIGLAGCAPCENWQDRWQHASQTIAAAGKELVAAIYADWKRAKAPPPHEILSAAKRYGLNYMLFDTFDKSSGSLTTQLHDNELAEWLQAAQSAALSTVVAGGLSQENLAYLPANGIDMIAVRGAACSGRRTASVQTHRVASFLSSMQARWRSG